MEFKEVEKLIEEQYQRYPRVTPTLYLLAHPNTGLPATRNQVIKTQWGTAIITVDQRLEPSDQIRSVTYNAYHNWLIALSDLDESGQDVEHG